MAKSSNLDKNLFDVVNKKTSKTPIQTVVPIAEKKVKEETIGLFVKVPISLKKRLKTYCVINDTTQDAFINQLIIDALDANNG